MTPSNRVKSDGSSGPLLPVMQMAVRCAPGISCGVYPSSRTRSVTARICSAVAFLCIVMTMIDGGILADGQTEIDHALHDARVAQDPLMPEPFRAEESGSRPLGGDAL